MRFQTWCFVIAGILSVIAFVFFMLDMGRVWVASTFLLVPVLVLVGGGGWFYSGAKHLLTTFIWGGSLFALSVCFFVLESVGLPTREVLEIDLETANIPVHLSWLLGITGGVLVSYSVIVGACAVFGSDEKKNA